MSALHFKDICFKHECKSGSHSIYKKLPKLHIWLEINISTHKVHCFSYPRRIHWLSDWLLSSTHIHLQHKLFSTYSCNASYPRYWKTSGHCVWSPTTIQRNAIPSQFQSHQVSVFVYIPQSTCLQCCVNQIWGIIFDHFRRYWNIKYLWRNNFLYIIMAPCV